MTTSGQFAEMQQNNEFSEIVKHMMHYIRYGLSVGGAVIAEGLLV